MHLTLDERRCEEHFDSTTKRNEEGRFVVQMPLKDGRTFYVFRKRTQWSVSFVLNTLCALISPFLESIQFWFKNSLTLDTRVKFQPGENNNSPNFYLPHHCVLKEDSTTTKWHVVFDASAKTTTGFSHNDCLLVVLRLQDDLFNILVRFRFFKIVSSADVAEMYRQVELDKTDWDFHRIFWRFTVNGPVETSRMTWVWYGVASSSYHSIRSLSTEVQRAILRDF